MVLLVAVAGPAQTNLTARWFQLGAAAVDKEANGTVRTVTSAMSVILLALDAGRTEGVPVDPKLAGRAIEDLKDASSGFEALAGRVSGHSIDVKTIETSGALQQYYDLQADLKKNGYSPPHDWKSYIQLLHDIVLKTADDLQALENNRNGTPAIEQRFLDLISQKVLLEKIGALSGIITVAMQ
ncbi:MAG: hypothetical protein ACREFO_05055 [Acetobacteraceae bacterium]